MSNVSQHMNAAFLVGFLSVPSALAAAVFVSGSLVWGMSAKDATFVLVLSLAPCLVAFAGFAFGRSANPFSASPLVSWWRRGFVAALGVVAAALSLPLSLAALNKLRGSGVWQPIAVGLLCMAVGFALGYLYGPSFRRLAVALPFLKSSDAHHRVG
jgi:hypothetical protein